MNIDINLHSYKERLKIRKTDSVVEIFDLIRKKYLVLQPEELVRQLTIHYLLDIGIAKEKIQVEKGIEINGLKRRFDIAIYDANFHPFLLIECKSHKVNLTQKTLDQIVTYNMTLNAPFFMVTNGVQTYCCKVKKDGLYYLKEMEEVFQ